MVGRCDVGSMNHKSGATFFPNSYLVHLPVEGREEKKQKENELEKHGDNGGVVTSSLWRRMEVEHEDIGEVTYYLSSEHGRLSSWTKYTYSQRTCATWYIMFRMLCTVTVSPL